MRLGMLNNIRKTGYRFITDNRFQFFGKQSNLFLLAFCLKENCITMTNNARTLICL